MVVAFNDTDKDNSLPENDMYSEENEESYERNNYVVGGMVLVALVALGMTLAGFVKINNKKELK